VDGLVSGRAALDWAAAEADTQNRPLHLVHAVTSTRVVNPGGVASVPCDDVSAWAAAESVAQDAARRARDVAPDLDITSRVVVGPAATAVLHAAQDAEMVVLGRRGLGRFTGLLRRSVSVQVTARAPCPVTVVHPIHDVEPGPSSAQVVAGVDGSAHSTRAIGCAFEAAARRGLGLAAVHAWMPRCPGDHVTIADDPAAAESAAWQKLEQSLAQWRDRYAGVTVTPKLMRCPPGAALVAESAGAALVVVGSRGRGSLRGLLVGSVSQIVLQHAHCPLTVVRARP
jgi:nucleotide-binding universal stress UspA family protein